MGRDASGNYTRTNGSFSGTTLWQQSKAAGIKVTASGHDAEMNDIATALTGSLARDGSGGMLANLNMNNYLVTSAGDATALTGLATLKQVNFARTYAGTSSGAANVYTCALALPPATYVDGAEFTFISHQANTGACTFNISGLAAYPIRRGDGTIALTSGTIGNGDLVTVVWRASNNTFSFLSSTRAGAQTGANSDITSLLALTAITFPGLATISRTSYGQLTFGTTDLNINMPASTTITQTVTSGCSTSVGASTVQMLAPSGGTSKLITTGSGEVRVENPGVYAYALAGKTLILEVLTGARVDMSTTAFTANAPAGGTNTISTTSGGTITVNTGVQATSALGATLALNGTSATLTGGASGAGIGVSGGNFISLLPAGSTMAMTGQVTSLSATGGVTAQPANVATFWRVSINGTNYKIPCYAD